MKFIATFFFLFLISVMGTFGQVGINTDSSQPHSSAGLDVKFENKGLLPPRMNMVQRNSIQTPADGLIVYCTDCGTSVLGALSIFIAGSWHNLSIECTYPPLPPFPSAPITSATQIEWKWRKAPGATGYKWNTSNDYTSAIPTGTDTAKIESDLNCNTFYNRYVWASNSCGNSTPTLLTTNTSFSSPQMPTPGINLPTATSIQWNWNTVPNAIAYKWSTIEDFGTAYTLTASTYMQTGLTCNSAYTSYVWAISSCGNSNALTMTQSTSTDPPTNPTNGSHISSLNKITWNWTPVPNATGYKWNTINDFATAYTLTAATYTETGLTCNTAYTSYAWAINVCGNSNPLTMTHSTDKNPGTPTPGDNAATTTEIVWNWNTVDGATGYKWNTINDYASAIPTIGNATFHTETGLTCNTAYTSYAWAVGACGNSAPLTMTKTTATNPVPPLQGAHIATTNSINWDWVAVPNATGYKWNTINDFASGIDINTTSHLETGLSCNTAYTSYAWAIGGCGHSVPVTLADSTLSITPAAPSAATHFATQNAITWHWNTVTTASGYKWNTLNDFSTATDMGTATSNLEQGLTCNTLFTRYVWAYNTCGVSQSTPLTTSTTSTNVASPAPGTHLVQPTTIQWHWNSVSGATGYKWSTNTNYAQATDMGTIITKTETTLTCNIIYTSYVWASSDCGISPPVSMTQTSSPNIPNTPITGNHTPGITQIVWNWNTVSNATGYKWNTTNNFSSAIDLGANATKTETGLTCNTSYTRYAWAYGPCGNSEPVTLNMTTLMNPPATPTVGNLIPSPNQIVWNWNTVAGATGYKWNTTDNFSTATDNGTATSKTETGLTCNSAYTRYAWAYSNCGNSLQPLIMAKSTTIFTPQPPVAGNHISQITQIEWKWEAVIGATGYKWNTSNDYASATDIPTGTSKIEIGLICNSAYTRFVWAYGACNGLSTATTLSASTSPNAPSTPTAGNHVPSLTQIVWNWTPVTNVTGYKWNSTNNFSTAIDMGTLTTFTETGLSCGTPCTRYVWSYNNCGYDLPVVLTQTTTACFSCGNNITITHVTSGGVAPVNKTVTYGTVTNIPGEAGKCWITSNLGSDHQATAVDDATEASSGWFWQFNRKKGYKHTGSVITPTWPTAGITENSDWTSANDPCTLEIGSGWRIPTITEWTNVDGAGNWNSWSEPWASGLKMHAAGALYPSFPAAGVLIERGVSGYYWSSTQALVGYADARFLYFYSTNSTIIYYNKPYGMTLRCIKNF